MFPKFHFGTFPDAVWSVFTVQGAVADQRPDPGGEIGSQAKPDFRPRELPMTCTCSSLKWSSTPTRSRAIWSISSPDCGLSDLP